MTMLFGIIALCLLAVNGEDYVHLGCYKDTGSRALHEGPHQYIGFDACHQWSIDNGYTYFALQNGGWCCVSNDLAASTRYGTATNCGSSGLGGAWANDLYQNTEVTTVEPTTMPTGAPTEEPTREPTSEPTRDCDLLHIDEFLLDCSAEWENAGNAMEVVYNATAANSQFIAQLAGSVANATAAISTNADNIVTATSSATTNAADITALQSKVAELEDMLHRMGVHSAAQQPAYSMADALGDDVGMADGAWNGMTVTGKDLGIVVLAAINVVMIAMMVIACKRSGGRTKYHPVAVGSDLEPINA